MKLNLSYLATALGLKYKIIESKWILLIVLAIGFLAYMPSRNGPFILDDQSTVVYSEFKSSSEKVLGYSLLDHIRERSFTRLTFLLNEHIWPKANAGSYRIVNIVIHLLNGVLLYLLTSLIWRLRVGNKNDHLAGLLAMSFFLFHPIQSQAINYITQRMVLLSTGFSLAAMLLYLELRINEHRLAQGWLLRLGLMFSIALAVLSKPIAITLFPLLIILELAIVKNQRAKIQWLSVFGLFTLGVVLIGLSINGPIDTPRISNFDYFLTQTIVIAKYFGLIFWPGQLSIDHVQTLWFESSLFTVISASFLHLALLFFAWLIRKKNPLISLSIALIYITFLPESAMIPLKDLMVEHRMYAPMVGASILFSVIIMAQLKRRWIGSTVLVVCSLLLVQTMRRNVEWQDKSTLWQSALLSNPQSSRALYSIGHEYLLVEDTARAMLLFSDAIDNNPRHVPSLTAMALVKIKEGKINSAEQLLSRALKLEPNDVIAAQNMGYLLEERNQPRQALKYYKMAVKVNKGDPLPFVDLGTLYLKLEKPEKAIPQFEAAIYLGLKTARLHNNLGYAFQMAGNFESAKTEYNSALEIDSTYILAKQNLDMLLSIKEL